MKLVKIKTRSEGEHSRNETMQISVFLGQLRSTRKIYFWLIYGTFRHLNDLKTSAALFLFISVQTDIKIQKPISFFRNA